MMTTNDIEQIIIALQGDFDVIQMPRTPFMLQKMVVEVHDHPVQMWAQCVLELQIKYDNIRKAIIKKKILQLEIARLEANDDEIDKLRADEKRIDLEIQDRAMLGARREFEALYNIYQSFGQRYTRADLDKAQPEYWRQRLVRQAHQDLLATGRVSQSNQEGLRQIGVTLSVEKNGQIGVSQVGLLGEDDESD